jgi:hypothetical protein
VRPNQLLLGVLATAALSSCGASPDASGSDDTPVAGSVSVTQQPSSTDGGGTVPPTDPTDPADATTAPATAPATEAPMTTDSSSSAPLSGDALEAEAVADLAGRIGVDASAITVTRHDEVSWSDGSLGCPKPGYNYIQVITAGYLIVLTADGRDYEYHGKPGSSPFYCAAPRPPAAGTGGP